MLGRSAGWGLLLAATVLGGCLPPGQRHLTATVEVDGRPVLETSFGVSDSLSPSAAWKQLEGQVFKPTSDGLPEPNGAKTHGQPRESGGCPRITQITRMIEGADHGRSETR